MRKVKPVEETHGGHSLLQLPPYISRQRRPSREDCPEPFFHRHIAKNHRLPLYKDDVAEIYVVRRYIGGYHINAINGKFSCQEADGITLSFRLFNQNHLFEAGSACRRKG